MFTLCFIHDIVQGSKTVLGSSTLIKYLFLNEFLLTVPFGGGGRNLRFTSFQCILIMTG